MANCIVRIHCGNCKHNWEIYWRDIGLINANVCPFCGEEIDRTLWDRDIAHAAGAALDANMELEKHATGYGKPLFKVKFLYGKEKRK